METKLDKKYLILLMSAIIVGAAGYFGFQMVEEKMTLEKELSQMKTDSILTTESLKLVIDSLHSQLASTTAERDDFERKYLEELYKVNLIDSDLQMIRETVATIEKLRQVDPELLKKYSKVYFLSENYVPKTLVKINSKYTFEPERDYFFLSEVLPFLENLMMAAESDNIDIKISSAYRSFGTQTGIKTTYKIMYGSGANAFVADQGYSEHQLGTTVDFIVSDEEAVLAGFEKTPAYQWLLDNAYKYGFIISYPQGNQYYQFEPWHWRFVGRELANVLKEQGKNFYDLEQREIDRYLLYFFD